MRTSFFETGVTSLFRPFLPPLSILAEESERAHWPRCARCSAMSAPPSPSNSETSTVNFTLEALADEVLDAFGDHPPPTARASVEAWLCSTSKRAE